MTGLLWNAYAGSAMSFGVVITHCYAFERFGDLERHAGAREGVIRPALRAREHEADASVRQIDTTRHLAAALVRAIREAKPAADSACAVEYLEVHAFIEVLRGFDRMRVFVLRIETHAYASARGCHD